MIIRNFTSADKDDFCLVERAAQMECGFSFMDMMEDVFESDCESDYGWGIWNDDHEIIGYCSAGGADVLEDDNIPVDCDDVLLSDLYILPEYRHNSYASQLVNAVANAHKGARLFAEILDVDLMDFYSPLGFRCAEHENEYLLVKAC